MVIRVSVMNLFSSLCWCFFYQLEPHTCSSLLSVFRIRKQGTEVPIPWKIAEARVRSRVSEASLQGLRSLTAYPERKLNNHDQLPISVILQLKYERAIFYRQLIAMGIKVKEKK